MTLNVLEGHIPIACLFKWTFCISVVRRAVLLYLRSILLILLVMNMCTKYIFKITILWFYYKFQLHCSY